ncbi:MAG: protein translocase component YidC [Chloroflexi bacterium]|nr:MAG: protein translocase component YidC [Chloroflexota bacterium]
MSVGQLWNEFFIQPMIYASLWLYQLLGHNFALAITVLTIAVRLLTLPLTLPAQKSAKKQQELQPKIQALQKKYAKDKERQSQELMKLYKEEGINPMGGCLPLLIQLPIIMAFYQSIAKVLADTPLALYSLAGFVAGNTAMTSLIPLSSKFLWLNLARPDPRYVLPILVVFTSWLQQKIMSPGASTDPQAASMNQTMQVTMPLMFGFLTMQWPSGLAIYFVVTNIVSIIIQVVIDMQGGKSFRDVLQNLWPQAASGKRAQVKGRKKKK